MMVTFVYQRNDEIPVHINSQVSLQDVENELLLAKKAKKHTPLSTTTTTTAPRKRQFLILSGLTVAKNTTHSSSSSSATKPSVHTSGSANTQNSLRSKTTTATLTGSTLEEKQAEALLQDVFLPTSHNNSSTALKKPERGINIKQEQDTNHGPDNDDNSDLQEDGGGPFISGTQHMRGREVFGFQTPKKSAGLKSLIQEIRQSPAVEMDLDQRAKKLMATPTRSRTVDALATEKHGLLSTPETFAKRRKLDRTISRMNQQGSSDEEEEEEEEEDEDEEESELENESEQTRRRRQQGMNQGHDAALAAMDEDEEEEEGEAKKSIFEVDEMGAERYFQDLHQKSRTSNNTLSKLPTLEHSDFIQAIQRAPVKHAPEMEMLNLLYEEQFSQWYFELLSGFNLLIYGYGSKRMLLNKFATTFLTDAPLVIVNGYFPTLSVKEILDRISHGALGYKGPMGTLQEQLAFIRAYFEQPDRAVQKLYLLVHNMDGAGVRSEKFQAALSLLGGCPQIHLVGSVDHINANILWDAVKSARFRWVWHEVTTFRPYRAETSFENSIMVRQGELGARGILFVLASLTSNGKGLFRILAEHQIAMEREGASSLDEGGKTVQAADCGLAYPVLFRKCLENFLVSNAVTFRTQLTEFRDHRIVQSKKGGDGVEILFIPLGGEVLEGILEKMV